MPLFVSNLDSEEEQDTGAPQWEGEEEPVETAPVAPPELEPKKDFSGISLQLPATIGIFGRSGAGKSCLTKAFLRRYQGEFRRILIFSGTRFNQEYLPLVQELQTKVEILPIESLSLLPRIIALQEKVVASGKQFPLCICLDNFVGMKKLQHDDCFERLASAGRHLQITTVIITQRAVKLSTTLRDNCHYLWITKISRHDLETIQRYQDEYTPGEFWPIFTRNTNTQFSSLFIQNRDPYQKTCQFLHPVDC